MMPGGQFAERTDELVSRMKKAPRAKGSARIYVPGEMEWECEGISKEHGVPLTQLAVENLNGLAEDIGEHPVF